MFQCGRGWVLYRSSYPDFTLLQLQTAPGPTLPRQPAVRRHHDLEIPVVAIQAPGVLPRLSLGGETQDTVKKPAIWPPTIATSYRPKHIYPPTAHCGLKVAWTQSINWRCWKNKKTKKHVWEFRTRNYLFIYFFVSDSSWFMWEIDGGPHINICILGIGTFLDNPRISHVVKGTATKTHHLLFTTTQ